MSFLENLPIAWLFKRCLLLKHSLDGPWAPSPMAWITWTKACCTQHPRLVYASALPYEQCWKSPVSLGWMVTWVSSLYYSHIFQFNPKWGLRALENPRTFYDTHRVRTHPFIKWIQDIPRSCSVREADYDTNHLCKAKRWERGCTFFYNSHMQLMMWQEFQLCRHPSFLLQSLKTSEMGQCSTQNHW